jgi:hypothetical protein
MTTLAIQEQVNTIKRATNKASSSKKAAKAFLTAAGIIAKPSTPKAAKKRK